MTEEFKKQIEMQARQAVTELLAEAKLKKGDVFVVGCSSSEIVGGHIGKDSSLEAARAVYAGIAPVLAENGIWLAAQCCEHLNRAIIIEREAAEKYGWEEVCVVPRPHAAMVLMQSTALVSYLPFLIGIGIPTGIFTGLVAGIFLKRVPANECLRK